MDRKALRAQITTRTSPPVAQSQFVGCVAATDCAKIDLPRWQESPRIDTRGRFAPNSGKAARKKEGKSYDSTHRRTQSPSPADADAGAVFHRPARIPRNGDATGGSHGPVVPRLHGRDSDSSPPDFPDGKPNCFAALRFGIGRH